MRIKICGIQNQEELDIAIAAGADAVGFQVGQLHAAKNFILPSTARRLTEELPPFVSPVLVTHLTCADDVFEIMERSGVEQVQLLRPPLEEVCRLRDRLPRQAKIIVTEYVRYAVVDFDLSEYYAVVDAVTLDCYNQEPAAIAQEQLPKHYQWDTAAEFIKNCPVPVILSGHLNPGNVADAIRQVKPFAVDACTLLKLSETGYCAPALVRQFIREANHAFLDE